MRYLIQLFLLWIATASFGQSNPLLPDDVVKNIEKRIEQGVNPSIAIGIIDKSGTHYYNFGLTAAKGKGVNENTIYEIGSISKVFTAILLARQAQTGKLKIDDPIKGYLPSQVKVPTNGTPEITFGHLSDHTSALPRLPSNMKPANPANPYADYTVDQLYAFLSGYELTRQVGSAYEYSNLAQGLLGHILALNAGTSYEILMTKTIASPLGMKQTKITFDKKMKENLAVGHDKGVEVSNWDLPTLAGAGAIRSSTSDMLRFLSANLGLTNSTLLPAMKKTHEVRHDKAGTNRVGLGWHIASGKEGDVIWHNGGTGGYRAFAGFVKETNKGVVVLTNSTESVDDIGIRLLNSGAVLKTIKPSIALELKKSIDSNGVDAATALYNDLKKNKPSEYDFSEDVLNTLGYSYLETNLSASLAIFKMNVDAYPTSSNVYDSYGEALLKNGQKDLAIENYKKSVQLNPGNTSGIQALEKLGVKVEAEKVEVPESVLETYVGIYQLTPSFNITITRDGKQLFAQATGQEKFEIFAKTENEFFLKVVNAQINFTVTNQVVESLTLFQSGQQLKGKKIN